MYLLRSGFIRKFFYLSLVIFLVKDIQSQEILDLDATNQTAVNLTQYLYLYEDASNTLSIQDVIKSGNKLFLKNISEYPAYGFTHSTIWGKFTFKGKGVENEWNLVFDYALLDKIELYVIAHDGRIISRKYGGNTQPLSQNDFKHGKPAFKLKSPGEYGQTIYFRVSSEDTLEIPLLLVTRDAMHERDSENSLISGIYYGIVLVMFVYNFFVFIMLRDKAYLNYVIYILLYGIVQFGVDGFLYEYIFPDGGYSARICRMVSANFAIIFALRFSDNFFRIRENFPRLIYIFSFMYNLSIMNSILVYFNFIVGSQIVFGMLLLSVLIFFYCSLRLFNKYPPVRLYFYAWIVFIAGTFLWSLKLFNIYIPGITTYSMQVGSAIEVTLLSFALGSRINLINIEKENMKLEALKQKQMIEKSSFQLEILKSRTRSIEKELLMARDIQLSMIPLHLQFPDIRSIYLPMDKVGGDFYDIIPLGENKLGIFISDVSGHGVPAALITAMLRSMILTGKHEMLAEKEKSWFLDPYSFMVHMNNSLFGHLFGNFISALYGIYDREAKTFQYMGAAHPPPILLEKGTEDGTVSFSFINLTPQMPPWGVKKITATDPAYDSKTITLSPSARLFLYSDGLMDNINYDFMNSEKGLESFKETILYDIFRNSPIMNLHTMLETISIQLLLYRDLRALEDDVCVVVLENSNE